MTATVIVHSKRQVLLRRTTSFVAIIWLTVLSLPLCASILIERHTQSADSQKKLDSLHGIIQDKHGFLWLASETGILRYDGSEIITYGAGINGLTSELNWSVLQDHQGIIWATSDNGISAIDPVHNTVQQYLHDENIAGSLCHNYTTKALDSSDQRLFVGTLGGIFILSADRKTSHCWSSTSPQAPLYSDRVRTIFEDSQGQLWIGYQDLGFSRYSPESEIILHFPFDAEDKSGLSSGDVRDFMEDTQGNIWIATWGGHLYRLNRDDSSITRYDDPESHKFAGKIIEDLLVDSQGQLWVASNKFGVFRYDANKDTFEQFQHDPFDEYSLLSNSVREIIEDDSGNLWFMTFPGGLNRYHPSTDQVQRWRHHQANDNSLSHNAILALLKDNDGILWAGTENGLDKINEQNGNIDRYSYSESDNTIPANAVTAIEEGPSGNIWIGTWSGGLAKLNKSTNTIIRYKQGDGPRQLKGTKVWEIFRDQNNTLWVGTETTGLHRYNEKTDRFTRFTHDSSDSSSLSSDYIFEIANAKNGLLWIATQRGVNLFNPITGKTLEVKGLTNSSLNDQRVKTVLQDENGSLWMGTQSSGIIKWTLSHELQIINTDSGLPSNAIATLKEDNKGFIWASTVAGVVKINKTTNVIESVLTRVDGLAGNLSNRNAGFKDADGSLYIGSTEGISKFNADNFETYSKEPKILLTELSILGRNVAISQQDSALNKAIHATKKLRLDHNANLISFGFANLNYAYGNNTRFAYILEGYNQAWIELFNNKPIDFVNVPSGAYTLKIKALNKNLQWSDKQIHLALRIDPPYWKSTAAYVIYSAMLALLIALVAKLVFLRAINRSLNQQVLARTEELKQANDDKSVFLANVSHELRTPLNAVIAFSQRLISKYAAVLDEKGLHSLEVINRNGHHLNRLIDDLLDMSKIESGKMEIKIAACNLGELIQHCIEDNLERAQEKGLNIQQGDQFPLKEIPADEQRLTQILHNLISNAIKYSDNGEIKISVDLREHNKVNHCVISVSDQGKGISDDDKEKLFKRFEQVDTETKYIQGYGTGLGLAIVDELARLHGGFVQCESTFGLGSTFSVYLPLKL